VRPFYHRPTLSFPYSLLSTKVIKSLHTISFYFYSSLHLLHYSKRVYVDREKWHHLAASSCRVNPTLRRLVCVEVEGRGRFRRPKTGPNPAPQRESCPFITTLSRSSAHFKARETAGLKHAHPIATHTCVVRRLANSRLPSFTALEAGNLLPMLNYIFANFAQISR